MSKPREAGRGSGVFVCPYLRVNLSPLTDVAPAVQVRLSWKGKSKLIWMLMDTGATVTVIPPGIAEDLGLDLKELTHPVKGVGGAVPVRSTRAYAQLSGQTRPVTKVLPSC